MAIIAFIGLGTMGAPMARNLVAAGHTVKGVDLDRARVQALVESGGAAAATAAEAARGADIVLTMLPKAADVRAALFAEDGALRGMSRDALSIDMSTIHPAETDAIQGKLRDEGIACLDAPVGRTSAHAERGELLIMVGGEEADVERARPVLGCLGDTIFHCGKGGSGARMKIVHNYMSISLNALTAETLTFAEASGLEVDLAIRVMSESTPGRGHMTTTYPDYVMKGNLKPGFMIELACKDLDLALDFGANLNAPMALGAAAREAFGRARDEGRGQQDATAIYESIRLMAGLPAKV